MHKLLFFLLTLSSSFLFAQKDVSEEILSEGKLLFRLEKGSWYGTDDILARFKNKKDSVGGYLSYETTENKINTIFLSRFDSNKILVRYEFDSLPKPSPIHIDTLNHMATDLEKNLISIRQDARNKASSNEDKFFSFYEKTSLNFIPVISNNERNVFVLTGPQVSGIVLIGNDYKLSYNNENELIKKEKIHNSILEFPYKSEEMKTTVSTYHSHVVTEYISSTDICTLLLYKDYVEWNQHIVMSEKEVSIFNLDKESLLVMKKKAWDKIYNSKKD
ncbi:hypothetical protein [Maribacter sp. LLG6340-A2]|uniref:hypothetical protein n=1 Tax=Maribacter sp. LLG6340-A2 TaxID=3160834 RepID=UPI00386AD17C